MAGKPSTTAHNKYNLKAYDRFSMMLKKGEKATLQKHAADQGESLNAWITGAIKERYRAETGKDEIPRTPDEQN